VCGPVEISLPVAAEPSRSQRTAGLNDWSPVPVAVAVPGEVAEILTPEGLLAQR
jgi:hypothetical protein